jgi:hypothetical protein
MTNVQLLQLAQSTAAISVTGAATAFGTVKASVAAFTSTGNPDTDWPGFSGNFQRELQSYSQAARKDAAPSGPVGGAGGTSATGGLPASVWANLPPAVQARLTSANPGKTTASAPAPAPATAEASATAA